MQFEKGQSGNPHGRPPGSRNKRTIAAEKLFDEGAEALTRMAIDLAKEGDIAATPCICLDQQDSKFMAIPLISGPAWHPTIASS